MNQNQKTALAISGIIMAVIILLSVFVVSVGGWQRHSFGMMDRGMMRGYGTMIFLAILFVVFCVLIIWLVVVALRSSGGSDSNDYKGDSPMDTLKRRYAEGEIDREEYETKKKDLVDE